MMYDREKSDLAIVAVKPTNKAGQPAAELVEPRAGAEGNASQQSTGRAQDRGTVSQALERIRQAARQRKKENFFFGRTGLARWRITAIMAKASMTMETWRCQPCQDLLSIMRYRRGGARKANWREG